MKVVRLDIHHEIVERCRLGDREAQYKLYTLYSKAMYNICVRMLHDQEEAADMLQEVFIEVFNRLKSFRFESTIGAWIKRITINKCINSLRKRKADLTYLDEWEMIEEEAEHEEAEVELDVSMVRRAMEVLPQGSKTIFSLYLLEGYDHKEISEILNITESTSKSQYMRAKQRVRQELLKQKDLYN